VAEVVAEAAAEAVAAEAVGGAEVVAAAVSVVAAEVAAVSADVEVAEVTDCRLQCWTCCVPLLAAGRHTHAAVATVDAARATAAAAASMVWVRRPLSAVIGMSSSGRDDSRCVLLTFRVG
jgi:hypothetical protein